MSDVVPLKINIPTEIKNWLSAEAKRNLRSQSAEIVLALRDKMLAATSA